MNRNAASLVALGLLSAVLLPSLQAQRTPLVTEVPPLTQLTAEETRAGWKLLFDGKSLDGWRGYKKSDAAASRWMIADGALSIPKNDGKDTRGARDLISTGTYDNFELAFEWKISLAGNSGIKYLVLEDMDSAIGHEYQIIDDERHPDAKIGPKRQTAALYDVLAASDRTLQPAGGINQGRIVVRGTAVEHWLNGIKVLSYELGSPALKTAVAASKFKDVARFGTPQKGHILVQDHGDQVWYRSIKIRALDPAGAPCASAVITAACK